MHLLREFSKPLACKNHVGTDAFVRPVEQSSTVVPFAALLLLITLTSACRIDMHV